MRSQHGRKDHRSEDDRGTAAIISSESADQLSNFVLLVSGWLGRQRTGKTRGCRVLPGSLRSGEEEETISAAQTRDGRPGCNCCTASPIARVFGAGGFGETHLQGSGIFPPAACRQVWCSLRVSEVSFDARLDRRSDSQGIREEVYRRQDCTVRKQSGR